MQGPVAAAAAKGEEQSSERRLPSCSRADRWHGVAQGLILSTPSPAGPCKASVLRLVNKGKLQVRSGVQSARGGEQQLAVMRRLGGCSPC